MCIQTGERNSASEVGFTTFRQWLIRKLVKVSLGQSEVNDAITARLTAEYKVAWFDISMNKATCMNFSYSSEHFNKYLNSNFD